MQKSHTTTKKSSGTNSSAVKASSSKSQSSKSQSAKSQPAKSQSAGSRSTAKESAGKSRSSEPVQDSKLQEFFIDELKDIYWAEQKLVKTLPKLQKAATSEELQSAFESHLEETKTHVQRLEQAFKLIGEKPVAKKCDAMEGITEEGSSVIEDTDEGTATRDVALVLAGQKAEHYEIATYGGLIQIAQTLGHDDIADLLRQTLEEEKMADEKLTEIAENGINYEASEEEEED